MCVRAAYQRLLFSCVKWTVSQWNHKDYSKYNVLVLDIRGRPLPEQACVDMFVLEQLFAPPGCFFFCVWGFCEERKNAPFPVENSGNKDNVSSGLSCCVWKYIKYATTFLNEITLCTGDALLRPPLTVSINYPDETRNLRPVYFHNLCA